MKTYTQLSVFLNEGPYWSKGVDKWGIIKASGPVAGDDGSDDYYPSSHEDLKGREKSAAADYYRETADDTLHIRTHNKETLDSAIKYFNQLPHGRTGNVVHEHYDHDGCDHDKITGCQWKVTHSHSGKRYSVLPSMERLAKKVA